MKDFFGCFYYSFRFLMLLIFVLKLVIKVQKNYNSVLISSYLADCCVVRGVLNRVQKYQTRTRTITTTMAPTVPPTISNVLEGRSELGPGCEQLFAYDNVTVTITGCDNGL